MTEVGFALFSGKLIRVAINRRGRYFIKPDIRPTWCMGGNDRAALRNCSVNYSGWWKVRYLDELPSYNCDATSAETLVDDAICLIALSLALNCSGVL